MAENCPTWYLCLLIIIITFFPGCQDSWTCQECVAEGCFFVWEKGGSTVCIIDLHTVDIKKIIGVVYPTYMKDCPVEPKPIPPFTTSSSTTTDPTTTAGTTTSPEPSEAATVVSWLFGTFFIVCLHFCCIVYIITIIIITIITEALVQKKLLPNLYFCIS